MRAFHVSWELVVFLPFTGIRAPRLLISCKSSLFTSEKPFHHPLDCNLCHMRTEVVGRRTRSRVTPSLLLSSSLPPVSPIRLNALSPLM